MNFVKFVRRDYKEAGACTIVTTCQIALNIDSIEAILSVDNLEGVTEIWLANGGIIYVEKKYADVCEEIEAMKSKTGKIVYANTK